MSTIQQDMTDAAAVWERLAKRLAEAHGDDSEEMWDQATQIHAAATIMHGWVGEYQSKLHAAVDEDAPKWCVFMDCGYCCHHEGPIECGGYGSCPWFKPRR